jgi:hypothetical protein
MMMSSRAAPVAGSGQSVGPISQPAEPAVIIACRKGWASRCAKNSAMPA